MQLTVVTSTVVEESDIVKEMLETGEYGIAGYPIDHNSIVEFVKLKFFGIDHWVHLSKGDKTTLEINSDICDGLWEYDNEFDRPSLAE